MSTPTLSGLLRENHRKQSEPRLKRKFLCWVGLFSMTPEVLAKFRVRAVFFVSADHLSLAWSKMKSWFPTSLPGSARSIRWDGEKTLPGMQRPRPKRPPVLQCHCPTPRHLLQTIKTSLHFLNNFFCVPKESVFTLDNLGTFFRKDYIRKKKVAQNPTNAGIFVNFLLVIFLYRTVICANFSKVGIVLNARLWKLLCPLGNMTGFFYVGFPHHWPSKAMVDSVL